MHLAGIAPDTIVAVATPLGRGGIGIVRLSGPEAVRIAGGMVRFGAGREAAQGATREAGLEERGEHGRARIGRVIDPRRGMDLWKSVDPRSDAGEVNAEPATIDDALVTVFYGPRSYTGENVVEIAAHGSPVVLEAIVRGAMEGGARLAMPGEFTQRAFLSGRIDLTQAEAVHDLIAAQTLDQARVAAQQLGGAISRRVGPAKESLLYLIALLEAGMDFASGELDDVEVVPPAQIAASIEATRRPLEAMAATFRRGQLVRDGAAIALIGPPNAGKSSLFNRLLERERAIVTPLPGTTRDTVEETMALGGIPLRLIDTAGLRGDGAGAAGIDLAEQQGIARSLEALADADLVLLIHDASQPLTAAEAELAARLAEPGRERPHIVVHNKVDLLAARSVEEGIAGEQGVAAVRTSALTGAGLDDLRQAILERLGAAGSLADAGMVSNLRQQEAITAALAGLNAAVAASEAALPHELILLDLHAALQALDSLTGVTTADDILARIFSTFCIGK